MGSPSHVRLPACTRSGMLDAELPLTAAVPRGLLTRFPILPAGPSEERGPGHPWALCPPYCSETRRTCQSSGAEPRRRTADSWFETFKERGRAVAAAPASRPFETAKQRTACGERRTMGECPLFRSRKTAVSCTWTALLAEEVRILHFDVSGKKLLKLPLYKLNGVWYYLSANKNYY